MHSSINEKQSAGNMKSESIIITFWTKPQSQMM